MAAADLELPKWLPNGLEMSRPASQAKYRAEADIWLAGSAPPSCWAAIRGSESNASDYVTGVVAYARSEQCQNHNHDCA